MPHLDNLKRVRPIVMRKPTKHTHEGNVKKMKVMRGKMPKKMALIN